MTTHTTTAERVAQAVTGTVSTLPAVLDDRQPVSLGAEQDAVHEQRRRAASVLPEMTFTEMVAMGQHLVQTGFLPKHVRTGAQAAAIMLAGRELGMTYMRSFRSLMMVEGKITESADSQLARFKVSGGRAKFLELTETRAVLWLRHPNGDEHEETFTMEDAQRARLVKQDGNYAKHPKAMMRSRCITAGLKSLGWDGAVDVYDPDELAPDPADLPPVLPDAPPLPERFQQPATPAPNPHTPPPPTERQRALIEKIMQSHVFTDAEREAVSQIITAEQMSRAIERAQKLVVERKAAEAAAKAESERRVAEGVAAAVSEANEPQPPAPLSSLLEDTDPEAAMRNALREGR